MGSFRTLRLIVISYLLVYNLPVLLEIGYSMDQKQIHSVVNFL